MIEIIKTKHIGFCFGVSRAVSAVLKEAEASKERIYTLGPLLHNPQMVENLKEKGIEAVDDVSCVESGVVAFRSHGIRKDEEEQIRSRGLRFIDTTCPFVKRVRRHALYLRRNGYKVVIAGDRTHPEVKSVLSYLDDDGIVFDSSFSIEAKKIGVVSQTTLDQETLSDVVRALTPRAVELRVYNTICESTNIRRLEAVELAGVAEAMLIVGGKNSSNTTKLYKTVKGIQPRTYHIETEDEIRQEWFAGVHKVGIAGGASTPDTIIDRVERRVNNF
ncbi:MAG: 4-hydroxy-3-methylbut-2-enyl diphosphate reductase [Syntrophorhabdales bacterium]|jgi:(E)-4-hydroxy-3-methyl-but-2-enyl pyrophosphate reductase